MATIQDIQGLGYTVGIAHGSVEVEEEALLAAQREAAPEVVTQRVATLTKETLDDVAAAGRLPETDEERQTLASVIANAALEMVITHTSERVSFHQDALAIAQESPDVWCVQQYAGESLIVQTYVSCKADGTGWDDESQAHLDALADAPSYAERDYQGSNPEAMQAASTLQSLGYACTRPKLGEDVFEVDGAAYAAESLVALAEKRAAEPPPPTTAEKVAAALSSVPELSAASKKALRDALA